MNSDDLVMLHRSIQDNYEMIVTLQSIVSGHEQRLESLEARLESDDDTTEELSLLVKLSQPVEDAKAAWNDFMEVVGIAEPSSEMKAFNQFHDCVTAIGYMVLEFFDRQEDKS